MRFDEFVDFIQTYEMTIPSSQKPKDFDFRVFENEEKDIEMPYDITSDELTHMTKRIKRVMKFNKRFYKIQESRKGKRPNEQSSKKKRKGSSKGKKVKCFNCGGLGHYAQVCPSLKNIKNSMQATWSNSDFEESTFTTFEYLRYDSNDMLAFVTSMDFLNDTDCGSDSDNDEFIDEQRADFLDNLIVEHERLIKSYMKNHDVLEAQKKKIDVLSVEKFNTLEKIRFVESEHHSLIEKNNVVTQEIKNNKPSSSVNENFHPGTKVLNEILDKCKTHGEKWHEVYQQI